MGISERKERERHEMRKRILDAAMTMFLVEGYEKTSLRNIADKIEYSPATIYLYFKDKDELLYEVQKEAFMELEATFKRDITSKEPLEQLRQICRSYVKFGMNNTELYDLMFIIRAPMNVVEATVIWENGNNCFETLLYIIKSCIDANLIRYQDVMIAVLSVWSMCHGLVSLNIRCRIKVMEMSEDDVTHAIDASIEEFLRVITV
jgi:AcrR family transcriptional regulator